jgi:malate dehydrogenase
VIKLKISIIGGGNVGATAALMLAEKELTKEVVLVDIVESVKGKALDMMCSSPVKPFSCSINGTCNYEDIKGSDVVVITAGLARKPGMTREDLLEKNKQIVGSVCENIVKYAPNAIIIVVTNPLDVMCYYVLKKTGFKKEKVIGMAGVLDSARLRNFIAAELDVSPKDVQGLVLGSHGDSMVPLPEYTTVSGIPIAQFMDEEKIRKLVDRTRNCGAEVVSYLKTGSAYYSPAASIVEMLESIAKDSKRVLPAAAYLEGEYGYSDIFLGVPIKLGKNGVEQIFELKLTDEAKATLEKSAKVTKENIKSLKFQKE